MSHIDSIYLKTETAFVSTKGMNNELVNRFNRKTFGIKNTDLTAKSGVFKIQYYYPKNNCTARTCYGKR